MKLLELHIDGFGKFQNRTFTFQDGLNIIYGENEAGKSTLHAFLRGVLFGIDKQRGRASKNDLYTKYEPWGGGAYQGYVRLESGGSIYRLERVFQKENKSFQIIDETNGCRLDPDSGRPSEILCGLTETSFLNTISVGQLKVGTDTTMAEELKDHITNLNTSGSIAISTSKAIDYLKKKKRALEASVDQEAQKAWPALQAEKQELEAQLASHAQQDRLNDLRNRRDELKQGMEAAQAKRKEMVDASLSLQKQLADYNLSSSAGISTLMNSVQTAYEDFLDNKQTACSRASGPLSFLGFAGCVGFLVLSKLFERQQQILLSGIFIAAAILSFIIGNILFKRKRQAMRAMDAAGKKISEIIAPFSEDSEPTEENINQFYKTIDALQTHGQEASQLAASAEQLLAETEAMQSGVNQLSTEIEAMQHLQWENERRLEQLSDCTTRLDGLKTALAANKRKQEEIEAVNLAIATINRLAAEIRNSFGVYLNTSASLYINEITKGAYQSISVDTGLNVFLNTPSRLIPVEQVSAGTADQVYLALRLAIAKFLWPETVMPLLFDDSFALYDDKRLNSTLSWLKKAYNGQILLFTCHTREMEQLKGANLIRLG